MLHYEYIVIDVKVCIALSHKLVFKTVNLNKDGCACNFCRVRKR